MTDADLHALLTQVRAGQLAVADAARGSRRRTSGSPTSIWSAGRAAASRK